MSTQIICSLCGDSVAAEDYEPDKSLTCSECTGLHNDSNADFFADQSDAGFEEEETEY
jgi:hypothetical protein